MNVVNEVNGVNEQQCCLCALLGTPRTRRGSDGFCQDDKTVAVNESGDFVGETCTILCFWWFVNKHAVSPSLCPLVVIGADQAAYFAGKNEPQNYRLFKFVCVSKSDLAQNVQTNPVF